MVNEKIEILRGTCKDFLLLDQQGKNGKIFWPW
jgi:hypothetical protein